MTCRHIAILAIEGNWRSELETYRKLEIEDMILEIGGGARRDIGGMDISEFGDYKVSEFRYQGF